MGDVFSEAHKAKAKSDNREAAKQELEQHKAEVAKRMLERMKPVFNDLPVYRPKDAFKLGLP
jgi:predicted Holliday junction resolvase-like endonuclease